MKPGENQTRPVGKVISGSVSEKILIRLHSDAQVDVGDILVIKDGENKYYVKLIDMGIQSLVPGQFIDDIAGQKLEHNYDFELFDRNDRFYKVCRAKVLRIFRNGFIPPRTIPGYFADVFPVNEADFDFLKNKGEIPIGNLRLGTEQINVSISLPAKKLISHHMLVVAATGKGKSNFAKVFASGLLHLEDQTAIIIDPHNEYYGSKGSKGLNNHHLRNKIEFFTPRFDEHPGSEPLVIHAEDLEPGDFIGIVNLSEAQQEALDTLYKKYGEDWLANVVIDKSIKDIFEDLGEKVHRSTIYALRRKMNYIMDLDGRKGLVFTLERRQSPSIHDKIKKSVLEGKMVILDTSLVGDEAEKLISSSIVSRVFTIYRKTKQVDPAKFERLPELLIVFEEAPRVLGKDVLQLGSNIFERVAREGRKFKVGICAITQMPSLLTREVLSQMNTKVILGLPAPMDRDAVVNSASHNIADESTEIQMLDVGEAIVTSPFINFPMPVKIFDFEKLLEKPRKSSDDKLVVGL
jgi:DNA helicase HerA-like ATPase